MNVKLAIEIISQFTDNLPTPVCVVVNENGMINGQLPTGLPTNPFIPINDNNVLEDDVLDVVDTYTSPREEQEVAAPQYAPFEFGECDIFAMSLVC